MGRDSVESSFSPSISVLLPVFMRDAKRPSVRFLRRALESALDQTYPGEFEIVVIDDGSPSPIEDIIRNDGLTESSTIRWLRSERNNGIVHALNTGLINARYELIARLDADDRWLPGKIDQQIRLFKADGDLSLVATSMVVVDAEGKELERHVRRDGWDNILRLAAGVGWCPFPHGSVLALTSIYRLLGGYSHDPSYAHCEDYHLWSNWIRFFKPAMVEEILYEYRLSSGSISETHREQQNFATQVVSRCLAAIEWRTIPENMRKLADLLGINLLQCGAICYRIWRFKPVVEIPEASVELLRVILPDRDISIDHDKCVPCYGFMDLALGFPALRSDWVAVDNVIVRVR